jgi:uncharacterized protein (TIGR02270 family)
MLQMAMIANDGGRVWKVMRSSVAIRPVLEQHVADTSHLRLVRSILVRAPHVKLFNLRRLDDRVAAHLDGLSVAGEQAWPMCDAALESPTPGAVFTVAVSAIEAKSRGRLDHLYALAQAIPEIQRGLMSAFGWAEQDQLRGIVADLLTAPDPFRRLIGITACAMHRVDPGKAREGALEDVNVALRARALRASGELGRRDLLPTCVKLLSAEEPESSFWAAWSAALLGNRGTAVQALRAIGEAPGPFRARAFRLALQVMDAEDGSVWLRRFAQQPENLRWLLQGSGIAGDPAFVPWLIEHMSELTTARLAGEAFSLITGLDLAYLDLERKPPEKGVAGPNDDPADPNVEMDADDDLPWPDPERISHWWQRNGARFVPGTRYFMGALLTREQCLRVLKEGFQRQRILAAHYLCLLAPGTPLFEWRAPAPRQLRLLASMD